ncbi:chromosome condensation protein CrcB, partial [Halobacteriales archaeon QS_9_67_17]
MRRQQLLSTLEPVALVAVGGFLGANARYLVGRVVAGMSGTFAANVAGCFLLGFLVYEQQFAGSLGERSRLVFAAGFLSSFTTYSTFALQTALAAPLVGAGYVLASYAAGFLAVGGGRAVALRVADRRTTPG